MLPSQEPNLAAVMDEIIYNALGSYYNALEKKGYMSYANMQKLLLLIFYRDFVFHDYRGLLRFTVEPSSKTKQTAKTGIYRKTDEKSC